MESPVAAKHRGHSRKLIVVNVERLERAAAEHGYDLTAIARAVSCNINTLRKKLSTVDDLRDAYERGLRSAGVTPKPRRKKLFEGEERAARPQPVAAREAVSFAPVERSSLIGKAGDDDLVLDAIQHGQRTVGDILRFTELTNARLRRSLDVLEHTCQIKSRHERTLQHFYLATEAWR